MNEKRNAHPVAGTTGQAVETAVGQAAISCNHFTMNGQQRQPEFISRLLLYGAENGQTLKDLVRLTQWPERAIRKEIEAERRAGALIISDNKSGYYLTDDPAEAQRFARSMQHRAREILRTARAIEGAAGLD